MMEKKQLSIFLFIIAIVFAGCDEGKYIKTTGPDEFSFLTYNIAGLPGIISQSKPGIYTKKIAAKINLFDIVVVQEDFAYHWIMESGDDHPYKSKNDYFHGTLGDGLNRFSYAKIENHKRISWDECYGYLGHASDCLTPKGFSVARHEIAPDVHVDIYNLHMDAGSSEGDSNARHTGVIQLIEKINSFSTDRAIIVAGDFNMSRENPMNQDNLKMLTDSTGLIDSRTYMGIEGDRIDKIYFRNGDHVMLIPQAYKVETEIFQSKGKPLSDHDAISVLFKWESLILESH